MNTKSIRKSGFTFNEDIALREAYLDISQDPIKGRSQNTDVLHSSGWRSVQKRMAYITKDVKKSNGCLKQVQNLNPSGASEEDIVSILYAFIIKFRVFIFYFLLIWF